MEISAAILPFLVGLMVILLLVERSEGEARAQTVLFSYEEQQATNQSQFVDNFVQTWLKIGTQVQSSHTVTASTGTGPDAAFGFAQCYGDLSADDCTICYGEGRSILPSRFPSNSARIYLDGCYLGTDNYSFYDQYNGPDDTVICGNTTRKGGLFQDSARRTVLNAVRDAPSNSRYFARGELLVSRKTKESAYASADCWTTLNASSCRACLENASASILQCLPWSEGRALKTGCFMRYSDTNFLNPVPARRSNRGRIVAIAFSVVSSVVVLAVGFVIALYTRKHREIQKKRRGSYDAKKWAKILNDSRLNFKYSTIEKATGYWDDSNKIGQGGFGTVYKGELSDGREIAAKRLFVNNKFRAADFYNEVNMISSVEHKNLVRLLGCCCSGTESILVYEYLPNMSLNRFIFDPLKGKTLNWAKRFEIIIGMAEGLVYLHENTNSRIIHRDIKAANILLDSRLRAKIADFGLARSFQEDKSHISTAIAGTLGYMAPEYLSRGQLTEKADVYSFGVLLLEVVTGKENNKSKLTENADSDSVVSIAWKHFQQGSVEDIFDPNLMLHLYPNSNSRKEVAKVVHVGLLCIQEAPSLRPTMSMALKMLVKDDELLPTPSSPPFIFENSMELSDLNVKPTYYHSEDDYGSVATVSHSQLFAR